MCLTPCTGRLIASHDIIVYKVLLKRESKLIAPFHYFEYSINEIVTKADFTENAFGEIEAGFHTVFNMDRALAYQYLLKANHYYREYVICKAIIPKGTVYIEGCDNDIVSLALKITEICH